MEIKRLLSDLVMIETSNSESVSAAGLSLGRKSDREGVVVGVGPAVLAVKVGQSVRCLPHCGVRLDLDNKKYLIANELTEVDIIL